MHVLHIHFLFPSSDWWINVLLLFFTRKCVVVAVIHIVSMAFTALLAIKGHLSASLPPTWADKESGLVFLSSLGVGEFQFWRTSVDRDSLASSYAILLPSISTWQCSFNILVSNVSWALRATGTMKNVFWTCQYVTEPYPKQQLLQWIRTHSFTSPKA